MLPLPPPIAAYIDAANMQDAARAAACFTTDATVSDEGTTRHGNAAIAQWVHETGTRYRATIAPVTATTTNGGCHVSAVVSGDFPGSPVTLDFRFTLAPAGITALEIGA